MKVPHSKFSLSTLYGRSRQTGGAGPVGATHGLHVIIPAVVVESSVHPSADRSHDGTVRSNNDSTWGDNDRARSNAARPVYSGRADDGACFRCRQGNEASD